MKAKIYTKTGDKGQTSLVSGTKVAKDDPRVEAYGALDELNSLLGVVRSQLALVPALELRHAVEAALQSIQNNLFNIGSHLACDSENIAAKLPALKSGAIEDLERAMDLWESELPPLRDFILPGGSVLAAYTHVARSVCRRAERQAVKLTSHANVAPEHLIFLNRLSDWLFLLARKFNQVLKNEDLKWRKD